MDIQQRQGGEGKSEGMNWLYPLTALVGGTLLLAWRVLRRKQKPAPAEEQVDYGTIVAPTG